MLHVVPWSKAEGTEILGIRGEGRRRGVGRGGRQAGPQLGMARPCKGPLLGSLSHLKQPYWPNLLFSFQDPLEGMWRHQGHRA